MPWAERIGPQDLTPGVLAPTPTDDVRLEPGYTGGESAADTEPAEASQLRAVVAELGLGRERVLSPEGRDAAAERWLDGPGGPDNAMTQQAPGAVRHLRLLRRAQRQPRTHLRGVHQRTRLPATARWSVCDHGCGGHSDVLEPSQGVDLSLPIWDTIGVDVGLFD